MAQSDYEAFNAYVQASGAGGIVTTIPRTTHGPTTQFVHFDASAFAAGTPAEQDSTRKVFLQHLKDVNTNETNLQGAVELLEYARQSPIFVNEEGGVAFPDRGFFITDDRSIKMGDQVREVMRAPPSERADIDRMKAQWTKLHEASHIILGTNEAGSDFMASAIMLRDHPESREMLRLQADLRMVYGLQGGPGGASLYGVECHDAIERALSMTPGQLQTADAATMHIMASEYDHKNEMNAGNKENSPEGRALAKISTYTGQGKFDGVLKKAWEKAGTNEPMDFNDPMERLRYTYSEPHRMVKALRENPSPDPADRDIASKLEASVNRLNEYIDGNRPPTPRPSPTPAPAQ